VKAANLYTSENIQAYVAKYKHGLKVTSSLHSSSQKLLFSSFFSAVLGIELVFMLASTSIKHSVT
jgi:hypothetical protein